MANNDVVDPPPEFTCCCVLTTFIFFVFAMFTIFIRIGGTIPLDTPVPTIEIDSISISNFTLSNPISAHWRINMSMHCTHSSFEFADTTVSIFHESKEEALWTMSLEKFDMRPKHSRFHFALDFWGSSASVDDSTVRTILEEITNNHGAVRFNVRFKADQPRTTPIFPIFKVWVRIHVNMLVSSCDVWMLFGPADKMQANMLKIGSQKCKLVKYIM